MKAVNFNLQSTVNLAVKGTAQRRAASYLYVECPFFVSHDLNWYYLERQQLAESGRFIVSYI